MKRIIFIILIIVTACEEPPGPSGKWQLNRAIILVMNNYMLTDTLFGPGVFYDSTFTDSHMYLEDHQVRLDNFPIMPERWNWVTDAPTELLFNPDLVPPEYNYKRGRTQELFRQNDAPKFVFNYQCSNSRVFYDHINMDNLGYTINPELRDIMDLSATQSYYVRLNSEDTISDRRVQVLIKYTLTKINQ